MKFAVIEYTSKTGTIWRHTPEHPNYLADPRTELDPTSFGCYVSALEGEHIPLAGFILGPVNQVSGPRQFYRKVVKKLTGKWPQTYSLEYLAQFDVLMIVHQITNGHEITAFTKRLKQVYPHLLIIGVPTHSYGILEDHWHQHPQWLQDFQQFMDTCDVFVTIVEDTKSDWQKLTTTPVVYLPQPYPVEYASQLYTKRADKKDILLVAGVTGRDNIKQGQLVAKQLQATFPNYVIQMTEIPGTQLDLHHLAGTRYELVPFTAWREHLQMLRQIKLVINTDYTFTRGRVQIDCAAVGTPSLGANSDGQRDFFPALAGTPTTPLAELVAIGTKLLTDESFYDDITTKAQQELSKYSYTEAAQRIKELYKHHGQKVSR
jgi:hypothetical protein